MGQWLHRIRAAQWASAAAAGWMASTAVPVSAATITFGAGITFTDSSVVLRPKSGYAVAFSNVARTTASSADGMPVAFEAGPAQTAASSSASGLRFATSASGNVTLRNPQAVDDAAMTKSTVRISGTAFLAAGTLPTKAAVAAGDSGFADLLQGGAYTTSTGVVTDPLAPFQVVLNNLTIGQEYKVQIFEVDARTSGNGVGKSVGFSNSIDTTNALITPTTFQFSYAGNANNTIIGAYVIGTFTADATSQAFYTNTTSTTGASLNGQVNALVLQAIPEPAALGLFGVAGFVAGRRRRVCCTAAVR